MPRPGLGNMTVVCTLIYGQDEIAGIDGKRNTRVQRTGSKEAGTSESKACCQDPSGSFEE